MPTQKTDFTIKDEGNILLLRPETALADDWADNNMPDAKWFNDSIIIQRRYLHGVIDDLDRDEVEWRYG